MFLPTLIRIPSEMRDCQSMKIMCDTNVILDVLLESEPFVNDSCKVLSLREEHRIDGFVYASS